jgi:hypothetical protein
VKWLIGRVLNRPIAINDVVRPYLVRWAEPYVSIHNHGGIREKVVRAYTAEDAVTQARIEAGPDWFQVIDVRPTE